MTAFIQHFSFEFRTGLRSKELLLMNYLFPLGCYVFFGLLLGSLNPFFIPTMIPAMVIFAFLASAILGLPNPLVEAREAGIYRSFKVNGVPAASILTMPTLTTAFHAIIVAVIITATAQPLFKAPLPTDWLSFVLAVLLTAFSSAGLGSLIGVISGNTRVTVLWSQLIFLPSMMLSGMMVPFDLLPKALAKVASLLPATYSMQVFLGWAYRRPAKIDPAWSAIILLAGGALAFGLALYLFSWDSRNTTRRAHPALAILALLPYALGAVLL